MTAAWRLERLRASGDGMTLDWIPGAGLAIAGGVLSFWRGVIVAEEKVQNLKQAVARIESDSREFQRSVNEELKDALDRLNHVVTELAVVTTEQAAFNRVCTKTLEGIAKKLEYHDSVLVQNHTDIELLKAGGQK